jgi:hypothetical protein
MQVDKKTTLKACSSQALSVVFRGHLWSEDGQTWSKSGLAWSENVIF